MSLFQSLHISGSALTANRLRMDVISSNIANANTTRARLENGEWQPYRRKMVEVTPIQTQSFSSVLNAAMSNNKSPVGGVKVTRIVEDESTPFRTVYDPEHPDADENGYVRLPNVDLLKEMVDLMAANRSYEANITALNTAKSMYLKALEIGK